MFAKIKTLFPYNFSWNYVVSCVFTFSKLTFGVVKVGHEDGHKTQITQKLNGTIFGEM